MWFNKKKLLIKEWGFLKMIASYLSAIISKCSLAFFTVLFAGNINKAHLSGVGLAQSINSIVVMSLSQGYAYVFETYGPQVFGSSSSESREVTNVLLKCLLQSAMMNLIVLGPYLNVVHVIRILPNSGLPGGRLGLYFHVQSGNRVFWQSRVVLSYCQ